jgi:nitrite reductase/ring-hydroxylating ferredoxin subunit
MTLINGHEVGVFNVGGEYYAIQNRCPHQGAPLCIGSLTGVLEAHGPGFDFEWLRDGELIRCPWHGWEFELASGRNLTDPRTRAKTYPVHQDNGSIMVEVRN